MIVTIRVHKELRIKNTYSKIEKNKKKTEDERRGEGNWGGGVKG